MMNKKPDSDLYPPYSHDYYEDMETWKAQTGCDPDNCGCQFMVKGTCQFEEGAIIDNSKRHPEVIF